METYEKFMTEQCKKWKTIRDLTKLLCYLLKSYYFCRQN